MFKKIISESEYSVLIDSRIINNYREHFSNVSLLVYNIARAFIFVIKYLTDRQLLRSIVS